MEEIVTKDMLTKANPEDIVKGNIVFCFGDYEKFYAQHIDEVLDPKAKYKGYYSDGCRYGLESCYVLKKEC